MEQHTLYSVALLNAYMLTFVYNNMLINLLIISMFYGTSTPKGSYSAKKG